MRNDAAVDYESAGLLDGLEGDDRASRARLLDRLLKEGFTPDELEAAVREDRLALLLVERVLGGRYSAEHGSDFCTEFTADHGGKRCLHDSGEGRS